MKKLIQIVESTLGNMLGIMGLIGIVLMTVQVITRYILKVAFAWSDEFLRTMFIWSYFIGAALIYSAGGIMRLEILDGFLEKHKLKSLYKIVHTLIEAFVCVFSCTMLYRLYFLIQGYIQKGTTSSTSSVPAWVLVVGMVVGFAMIAIFAIRNIVRLYRPSAAEKSE